MALYGLNLTEAERTGLQIDNALKDVCVCKPCTVVKVNDNGKTVDCQITDSLYLNTGADVGINIPYPILTKVPVLSLYSQNSFFSISIPIAVGDTGLLIFADRSLQNFLTFGISPVPSQRTGDAIEPTHDLAHAIFIQGFSSTLNALNRPNNKIVIKHNAGMSVELSQASIDIKNGSTSIASISSSGVNMTGDVHITGTVYATNFERE